MAKLVFIGSAMFMIPMCTFFGVLALFGGQTVTLGQSHVTGVMGLVLGLIYGPLFAGIFGLLSWPAAYLGVRLFGAIKPLQLEYVADVPRPNQPLQATPAAVTPAASAPVAPSAGVPEL